MIFCIREFLILIAVLAIGLTSFSLTYLYNYIKTNKVNILNQEIIVKRQQLDSISSSNSLPEKEIVFDDKQLKLLLDFGSTEGRHLSLNELKKTLNTSEERLSYFTEFNTKMGFKDYNEFLELIQTKKSRDEYRKIKEHYDSLNLEKITVLGQELNKLSENKNSISGDVVTKSDQLNIGLWATAIAAVLLILLRFLYYGVSWSILTLRKKYE